MQAVPPPGAKKYADVTEHVVGIRRYLLRWLIDARYYVIRPERATAGARHVTAAHVCLLVIHS